MNDDNKDQNITAEDKVIELEEKVKELENNWKRALADYINLQKRVAEDKIQAVEYANMTLIRQILPSLDNLEMLEKHEPNDNISIVAKEFRRSLQSAGVTEVLAMDQDFDPTLMDAVEMTEGEKNKVVEVIQKGYLLNERLIRPARVKVGLGKKEN